MNRVKRILNSRLANNLLPVVVIVLVALIFSALTKGRFLSKASVNTIINQAIITGIIATGAVFIFASGNVNIALGGTTAISAIVGVVLWRATGSVPLMMAGCIACAVVILVFGCMLSVVFKIKVVSVTMIMMGMLTAMQTWIMMKYVTLSVDYSVIAALNAKNAALIIFGVGFLIFAYLFCFTKIGRSLKMIGENAKCTIQTGISPNKYIIIAFVLAGIAAGLGAILLILRSGSVSGTTANGLNMDVMLAIVLGGMPVTGGYKSKIAAGVFGSFMVTMLNSGLLMIGVSATIVQAVRGLCFLVLIVLSNKRPDTLPVKEMA